MELLNYPCSPKDQNTLPTRKPKKLHPRINNHTQTHIKQIKIKSTKNWAVTVRRRLDIYVLKMNNKKEKKLSSSVVARAHKF